MKNLAATIIKGSIFGATAFVIVATLTERQDRKALTNIAYDSVDMLAILNYKGDNPNV